MNLNLENAQYHSSPFKHWIIDNFLDYDLACRLSEDFPSYEDSRLKPYSNSLEEKKLDDSWLNFNNLIYRFINELQKPEFIKKVEEMTAFTGLNGDSGLHGSGLFLQKEGGRLNPHIDYKLHPKLLQERVLSFLIYLSPDWTASNGGDLILYEGNEDEPNYEKKKIVNPIFNRVVIFECTKSSWHAVTEVNPGLNFLRKAIGIFYLKNTFNQTGNVRAKYAPNELQLGDEEVKKTISLRGGEKCKDIYNS